MDDLVVLILTLIIVVLGAIGQFKKKKPEQPNESQNNSSEDFWDMLTEENEFVPQQPKVTPEVKQVQPDPVAPKSRSYTFSAKNEGISDLTKTDDLTKQPMQVYKEEETDKTNTEKFSLRKAIIYSEIINRKYT